MWNWLFGGFWSVWPRLLKYQIVTKILMALLIMPLYGLATLILTSSEGAITNATFLGFATSWRGILLGFLSLGLLLVGLVVELSGFIVLTARGLHDQPETSYRRLIVFGFQRLHNLLGIGGLALLVYFLFVIPLSGAGPNVSFLQRIQIPRFISAFIEENFLYSLLLAVLVTVLAVLAFSLVFTMHLIIIGNMTAGRAMAASVRLVRTNLRVVLVDIVGKSVVVAITLGLAVAAWWFGIWTLMMWLGTETNTTRTLFAALLLVQQLGAFLIVLMQVPFEIHLVTRAFYRVVALDEKLAPLALGYPELQIKPKPSMIDRWYARRKTLAAILLAGIGGLATFMGFNFEELFRPAHAIEVVAHRAGGYAAPENSLSGLEKALQARADWVEVDVQRTADGHYILNHDNTFARAARDNRASFQMTLAQIKTLDISMGGPTERVPEVEEFLRAAAGKTKVILELKGVTANQQMADDMVALVKRLGLTKQVMLMSLDYQLVRYMDQTYPDIDTGFVYFVSIGDVGMLSGDYIILEEGEATEFRLLTIEIAGKKSMVWTVNDEESMKKFAHRGVSAIITDRVATLQEELQAAGEQTTTEMFWSMFVGVFD